MTTKVLIKNMDEQLYRMLKAKAALMGISVSEAIQQAISLWLNVTEGMNDYNYVVLKTDPRALKAYNEGKYVLACDGEFIGAFDSEKEAVERGKGHKKCMLGSKNYEQGVGEWGWSSIALE
jgi:hypothetical protein